MHVKKIIFMMICIVLWAYPSLGETFGYTVDNKEVYGHKSRDGAISYFVTDENGNWLGDYARLSLHKVFPVNGETFYYFYVEVTDGKVKKNPVTDVVFLINGKVIDSKSFPGLDAKTRR